MSVAPPEVPERLKELLADYPEYIVRLQATLAETASKPPSSIPRFELAVSAIERELSIINDKVGQEIEQAVAAGDDELVESLKEKQLRTLRASVKYGWIGDDALFQYFSK